MAVRLYATGTIGDTLGMKWIHNAPAGDDIDGDNDGVMTPNLGALIDLSDLSSQILGQQVSQSASYTVKRIWVSMRNVDDIEDNDESTYFAGTLRWWYPTQHRLNSLSLARQIEKFNEADQLDADSFFLSTENDYSAMRFNWSNSEIAEYERDQVRFATSEALGATTDTQWSLAQLKEAYNDMHPATKENSLFLGRWGDMACKIPWTTAAATGVGAGDAPALLTDYNSGAINAKVLAGLIFFNVSHSSLDEVGGFDDDYKISIGIEYDVGVDA